MSKITEALGRDLKKTASKSAAKPKAKVKHSFHVKQADDDSGFVVDTHKDSDDGMGKSETSIHKNINSVAKHMKSCCGESEPE